jgi:hypothetical protein
MESKKGGASIDDLFGRKEANKPSSGSSGYFNSVFATSPNSVFFFLFASFFVSALSIRS